MFELDVYWAVMGQQDPVEWMENYPNRFKFIAHQGSFGSSVIPV